MIESMKRIFGVTENVLPNIPAQQAQGIATANYLPESEVPTNDIEGTADDGPCWTFWRVNPQTGVRWFRRVSR